MKHIRDRFEAFIIVEPMSGCWLWTGCVSKTGYGSFAISNYPIRAHRASWRIYVGKIPKEKCVLHRCDTPCCVNPYHLFLGTLKDNSQDAARKGRLSRPRGASSNLSKLTEEQVITIRKKNGPYKDIAKEYGVSASNICMIKNYKSWNH
jgi:hypothetical protein